MAEVVENKIVKVAEFKDVPIFHDPDQEVNTVKTMNKPKSIGYQGLLYIGDNGVCIREDGTPHVQEKTDYVVSCFFVNEPESEKAVKLIEKLIEAQERFTEYLINKSRKVYEKLQELGIESTYSHNLRNRKAFNHIVIGDLKYKITHLPDGTYRVGHSNLFGTAHSEYAEPKELKPIIEKIVEINREHKKNA